MKKLSIRIPDAGPFGETRRDARERAMVAASLVKRPSGGCVESVVTAALHFRLATAVLLHPSRQRGADQRALLRLAFALVFRGAALLRGAAFLRGAVFFRDPVLFFRDVVFFRCSRSGKSFRPVDRFHSSYCLSVIWPSTRRCANFLRCALLLNGIGSP